jgi:1,4-alpha-glucan branching enzyme
MAARLPPHLCGRPRIRHERNMGWMHDTLFYFSKDPIFRKYHQNQLTFSSCTRFRRISVSPFLTTSGVR